MRKHHLTNSTMHMGLTARHTLVRRVRFNSSKLLLAYSLLSGLNCGMLVSKGSRKISAQREGACDPDHLP
jgi:hypothetical protein